VNIEYLQKLLSEALIAAAEEGFALQGDAQR
jgi:hypothetical protein